MACILADPVFEPSLPMLSRDDFLHVVRHTPLVSIDLLIEHNGRLLMGQRVNEPARGTWFVPGGRINKDETLETAYARLCDAELGVRGQLEQARLVGAFTHLYDTNFAAEPGISSHYVVLAYKLPTGLVTPDALHSLPPDQHAAYAWIGPADGAYAAHPNSTAYFSALGLTP